MLALSSRSRCGSLATIHPHSGGLCSHTSVENLHVHTALFNA